jgi:hypothetical protein
VSSIPQSAHVKSATMRRTARLIYWTPACSINHMALENLEKDSSFLKNNMQKKQPNSIYVYRYIYKQGTSSP